MRDIKTDFQGHVSELLAKVTQKGKLEDAVTKEDQEILLEALQILGRARQELRLQGGPDHRPSSAAMRRIRAAASARAPVPGEPISLSDILNSRLWGSLANFALYEFQTTMFQPVGGMDMIGKAFAKQVGDLITLQCQGHARSRRTRRA